AIDPAVGEGRAVLQRAVVHSLNVGRGVIARPPVNQSGRRCDAGGLALTCAAGVVDRLDFTVAQGAIKDFNFIDAAFEKGGAAEAGNVSEFQIVTVGGI